MLRPSITKRRGHTKINDFLKIALYNFILQNPQVVQSPIDNDCIKLYIDGQGEPELFPKLLFQVSVRELNNIMAIPPEEGVLKEAREEEDNIIISDSTLRNILPPQLNNMADQYKVLCGCECCTYVKSIHLSLLIWRDFHSKHLKDRSNNAQNRRSGELSSRLFETYKNYLRTHGCHIYNYAADMAISKMCPGPSQYHGLPHWKYVLRCCEKCPGISIPCLESNKYESKMCSKIRFSVNRNVSRCTVHGIHPYEERTIYSLCYTDLSYVTPVKVYT